MAGKSGFTDLLKRQGYEVSEKRLGGGLVNDVKIITARKGDQVYEYVLKTYNSEKDSLNMVRGYDAISSLVRTPAIVYRRGKEVAYELVSGKSVEKMIVDGDPEAPEALKLLAKELESLHSSKNRLRSRGFGSSSRKRDRIIHGDAHPGNFLYSEGKIYLIDTDNVRISDYNVDIGRVIFGIDRLAKKGRISKQQASKLSDFFLVKYDGEDPSAVEKHRKNSRFIMLRNMRSDQLVSCLKRRIGSRLSLESRVAVLFLLALIYSFFLIRQNAITGLAVWESKLSGSFLFVLFTGFIGLILFYILLRNKDL